MNSVTIGVLLPPTHGDMPRLRAAWLEAEELGADQLFTVDHFHATEQDTEAANDGQVQNIGKNAKNFEGTTIEAAMAATTTRAEIGCIVHGNSYRNPNLMADMARTIDHISGGRFILGMGSGYMKADYEEYGYEFGTQKSRLQDLARDLAIMKMRFTKLNPPPLRRIPLLIASMGENIGMRIVAEHADIWHLYGPFEKIRHKIELMKIYCSDIGRDFSTLRMATWYMPQLLKGEDDTLENYMKLGIRHMICLTDGPNWDLTQLRELLAWRKTLAETV